MFIFREEYYHSRREPREGTKEHQDWMEEGDKLHNIAEVIIAKQRHGPTGRALLHFNAMLTKFGNLAKENYLPEEPYG
jgi:replicative DNA helicase